MTEVTPTNIVLHKRSKQLEVTFDDGQTFHLPAEFLRVHSPSAAVQGHSPEQAKLESGKRDVGIEQVEPVGHYAIKIFFDDGHNTGIFTWELLHQMGRDYDTMWQNYLDRLQQAGRTRQPE